MFPLLDYTSGYYYHDSDSVSAILTIIASTFYLTGNDSFDNSIETIFRELLQPVKLVGTIHAFPASTTIPDGFLLCDGSTYDTSEYPELFVVLGVSVLPDYTDKFLRQSTSSGGSNSVSLTNSNLPPHSHSYTPPIIGSITTESIGVPVPSATVSPLPANTSIVGSGTPFSIVPEYEAVQWLIMAK